MKKHNTYHSLIPNHFLSYAPMPLEKNSSSIFPKTYKQQSLPADQSFR